MRHMSAPVRGLRSAVSGHRRARAGVLVLVAMLLGGGLWLLRWSGGDSTATPDTFWYSRDALRYSGHSLSDADMGAARITCGAMSAARHQPKNFASCVRYRLSLPAGAPVRFQRIFTSRPGYALMMAPFVRALGRVGFAAGTAFVGTACGVAMVLLGLAAGLRPARAFLAEAAFYLLPTGLWVSRMLAEAPMALCVLVALIGAVRLLRGRPPVAAAILLTAGLGWMYVVKPANGVALTGALLAGSVALLPFARPRRAYVLIAAISAVVLAGNLLAQTALHLPGLNETLQDTFTRHFRLPDVADPWKRLPAHIGNLWRGHLGPQMLDDPLIPAAYLLGVLGLARIHRSAAWPLLLTGLTGVVVVAVHPLASQAARLATVTWIPVAFGLAALVALPRWAADPAGSSVQRRELAVGQPVGVRTSRRAAGISTSSPAGNNHSGLPAPSSTPEES